MPAHRKVSLFCSCLVACAVITQTVWTSPVDAASQSNPRELTVILSDHGMQPGNICTIAHQSLHLHVINQGRHLHQFSIPDFYVYSRALQPGESSDITFAPYKSGRFEMTSDPTGDKSPEYHGQFVVTPHG